MKSACRAVGLATGLVLTLSTVTSGPEPSAITGTSTATWTLVDYQQSDCVTANSGRSTYFPIWISGSWSTTLEVGLRSLPEGSRAGESAPIPPGSNDGSDALRAVPVTIPPIPAGVYTAQLFASNEADTQTVPITLRVQPSCP